MVEPKQRDWSYFALLLVDLQRNFWPVGGRPGYPDFPANIVRLLALCRTEGLEVIHVRSKFKPDKTDWMLMYRRLPVSHHPCIAGRDGVKPVSFAARKPRELVIYKQTFDALHAPNLVSYLRENNKRIILVAGLLTSVCVLFTVASVAQLGFLAVVVEDCCADSPEKHKHTLDEYQFMFERTTTDAIPEQHSKWLAALAELDGHGASPLQRIQA